jgi:hypothetical protein
VERAQVEEMQRSQQKQVNTPHIHFIMNVILKPLYANGGRTLSIVYLEKMCMTTEEGFVAFYTIQSCVQLCMNEYKGRL